jgi:Dyp-type peroxidase family
MDVTADPVLECGEIQGNILAGFRKDYSAFIFANIADSSLAAFRGWLKDIAAKLSYSDAVLHFNRAFSLSRRMLETDPPISAIWVNLALSGSLAQRILKPADYTQFEQTFLNGPLPDAAFVGEPPMGSSGGPQSWVIGGPGATPDLLLIVGGDDPDQVSVERDKYVAELTNLAHKPGAVSIHLEQGHTRAAQRGHEHFGFKDCISQPGIRGVVNVKGGMPVTKRWLDASDPSAALFSAPGQPLCWPGEFVLGYPRKIEGSTDPMATMTDPVSDLLKNGSYLVYRRLRQDVATFQAESVRIATLISGNPSFGPRTADFAAASLIGRWSTGAPLVRAPLQDSPPLGNDPLASNNFLYTTNGVAPIYNPAAGAKPDIFPQAAADTLGKLCPFVSHVRKVNPRSQATDQGSSVRTLEHRILRRGIPYGEDYDSSVAGSDAIDRGLQFLCYQSSIERGFQFLMNQWANSASFPLGGGYDPVIGQIANAPRSISFVAPDGSQVQTTLPHPLVSTTGAAYLFSPSRKALETYFGASSSSPFHPPPFR